MEILQLEPKELKPNSFSLEIYGNLEDDSELEKSILGKGILQPITAIFEQGNYRVLDGNRRLRIAKKHNLKIPTIIKEVESELEECETALSLNKYREKTPSQKLKEGEAWEKIFKLKASQARQNKASLQKRLEGRFQASQPLVGSEPTIGGNVVKSTKTEDLVAEKIG